MAVNKKSLPTQAHNLIKVVITLHHSLSSADIDFHIRNAIYFALHILGSVAKILQNLVQRFSGWLREWTEYQITHVCRLVEGMDRVPNHSCVQVG